MAAVKAIRVGVGLKNPFIYLRTKNIFEMENILRKTSITIKKMIKVLCTAKVT